MNQINDFVSLSSQLNRKIIEIELHNQRHKDLKIHVKNQRKLLLTKPLALGSARMLLVSFKILDAIANL